MNIEKNIFVKKATCERKKKNEWKHQKSCHREAAAG